MKALECIFGFIFTAFLFHNGAVVNNSNTVENKMAYTVKSSAKAPKIQVQKISSSTKKVKQPVAVSYKKTSSASKYSYYNSAALSVKVEEITKPGLKMWISYINVKNPKTQLNVAFAGGRAGGSRQKTSVIAKNNNAVFAVNGSAFSYKTNEPGGPAIKKGVLYNDFMQYSSVPLCITEDGLLYSPDKIANGKTVLQNGAYNSLWFGPVLVNNRMKVVPKNLPSCYSAYSKYPRTAIGMIKKGEYIVITADGKRPNYSMGLTCSELADIFISKGCTYAYNLDGGGSVSVYFKGKLLNKPSDSGGERPVANILYFTN